MKLIYASALCAVAFWGMTQPGACEEAAPAAEQVIGQEELAALAGGGVSIEVLTGQSLGAANAGNTVGAGGDLVSGQVNLSQGAFDGFSGIGNFVINTGNNNNLQSSLAVNIVLAP